MAPIIHELKRRGTEFQVCITAQHREMLDQVLDFFGIQPDYDLELMRPGQSLNHLSGNILLSMDQVLEEAKPDLVFVHGDTTTSVMIAWAAFHKKINVCHIEAGLRTHNRQSPFPEEINRQLTARLADFHFAPTKTARENLIQEKLSSRILVTGNTIVDALDIAVKIVSTLPKEFFYEETGIKIDPSKKLILVTGHRRENFGKGMKKLCEAFLEISKKEEVEVVFPVHLNPQVQKPVYEYLGNSTNIHLISPVSYPSLLWLMQKCRFIISDSGGIQEEAPSFGKIVLVTREFSERMEGVEAGYSVLVGTNKEMIIDEASKLLDKLPVLKSSNPYGDGRAAERILDFIEDLQT